MDTTEEKNEKQETSELVECQQKAEEYLNGWKRAQADFVNYKKDEGRRIEEIVKFSNEGLIMSVIEVLDDLELATAEVKNDGLNQVVKKFQNVLKKYDVERIGVGTFDPVHHEAVSTEDGGSRLEEIRGGYTMHGKVIRPTRVKIIK